MKNSIKEIEKSNQELVDIMNGSNSEFEKILNIVNEISSANS